MRKLTVALAALAAITVPVLAEAAGQQPKATPPVSTVSGGSSSSGAGAGKVTFNPFSITRKIDKSSPILFQ